VIESDPAITPVEPGIWTANINGRPKFVRVKEMNGELYAIVDSVAVPVADLKWWPSWGL
jgi:hypothetical protein